MSGLKLPSASNLQPLSRSAPRGNIYEGREVNVGRVQGQFSGGPAIRSGAGEGLGALAGGLGKWYEVLAQQEEQKQTFEAMEQINLAKAREREMLDKMDQMTGLSGVTAPYMMEEFYKKERQYFQETAKGDFQKMIFTRFMDSEENRGLDSAMAHRTAQLDNYERSVMAGDQAVFESIAADSRSTPIDITRAAIPFVQRQAEYLKKRGLDGRAALAQANGLYRKALHDNAFNYMAGAIQGGDPEGFRIASGQPRSASLPVEVGGLADRVAQSKGMDPALIRAVISVESAGKQGAVSGKGARGLMQLMPDTAKELGVNPGDPEQNVRGGAEYLNRMLKRYDGNLKRALMAYNWGPGNVDRWIQKGGKGEVPLETQKYVRKVMADYNLQKGGGRPPGGGALIQPVQGFTKISSGYGKRNTGIPGASTFHEAIDIPAPVGTPVQATIGGTVATAANRGKNGNYIVIDGDDGRQHYFLHLNNFAGGLQPGQRVEQGQEIGAVGNSGTLNIGPHLDYRIKANGKFIDPSTVMGANEPQVTLGGSGLILAGDNFTDAADGPLPNPEARSVQMAMARGEIDPSSSGDWVLEDYAALASTLFTQNDWAQLDKMTGKALDARIKTEKDATIAALQQLDLDGELTMPALKSTPGFENLSYDEQLLWRKTARGHAGEMGQLRQEESEARTARKENWNNTKKDIEVRFYAAMETGDIPRTREGVARWLNAEQEYWGDNITPSNYFEPTDIHKLMNYAKEEAGRFDQMAKDYITMNPSQFKGFLDSDNDKTAIELKFRKVFAERINQLGYRLDDDRIPGLLEQLATDKNFLKGKFQLPGEYSAGNKTVRDELIKDMILAADAPDTGPVRRLTNMAIDQGKSLGEMKASDADQWRGKGRMTLFDASGVYFPTRVIARGVDNLLQLTAEAAVRQHKDHFEEAGKYFNIDPDFLACIAYVASNGERYAVGKLTPDGRGLMQIDGVVAEDMGLIGGAEFDPRRNILAAARSLNGLLDAAGGDYGAALRMYAAGMPPEAADGFIREVNRLYSRNYGFHSSLKTTGQFQLPNYGEDRGSE